MAVYSTLNVKGEKMCAHLNIMGNLLWKKKNIQKENFLTPVVQFVSETC